jgi:antitoxin component YwqK of YwqJK toxin-antitoxin module
MNGRRYIGEWVFYHKKSTTKMIVENYNANGLLEGERFVYYENGAIAEQANYKGGKLNGEAKWFLENNKVIRTANYVEDELHGKTITYNAEGDMISEGNFIKDQKKGIWKYYNAGNITKEIDHTNNKVIKKYK